MNVSLFITCLTDNFYPRVGQAVVAVLEHLGCAVSFPSAQTCCGQPMFNAGYHDDARDLAKRMIDVFEDAEVVITPSGSCAAMIREYYPVLLGDDPDWAPRSEAFCNKTFEFVEFLVRKQNVDLKALGCKWSLNGGPTRTTYHYSCHLRGIGMTEESPVLLQQIEGIDYIPLPKKEQCCGFGGTFAVKYPDISGAIVHDKVACIEQTHADVVVSNDGGCTMNIHGAAHRRGNPVKFMHIAEIIAEGLDLI